MKKLIVLNSIVAFTMLNFQSCTLFIGVKKIKYLSEEQIISKANQFNIPAISSYFLDSSYLSFIEKECKNNNRLRNDHLQPLQAIYYTKENSFTTPISWQINCYAGGFPNLKWNRNGTMEVFPPKEQAPLDSLFSLKQNLEFFRPLSGVSAFNSIEYDYIIVVFWSRFMNRQSKILIQAIQNNATLANNKKIKILYVNNDNLFSKMR